MIVTLAPGHRMQYESAPERAVLLYPEGMVELSRTAAAILGHCRQPIDTGELIGRLRAAFDDAGSGALAEDVRAFVEVACERGWLTRR